MSLVLLVGVGPLPGPNRQRIYAPGLRLQSFVDATLRAGSQVLLGEIYFAGIEGEDFQPQVGEGIQEHRLLGGAGGHVTDITNELNQWLKKVSPDCIIALTDIGCLAVANSDYDGPIHCDYFGHPMAERQQMASVFENDSALAGQWLDVLPVLLRADRFSTCSNSQRLALTGELGVAGRLNRYTCSHEFVEIVPPSLPFKEALELKNQSYLVEKRIPADAKIIFASGGYNTWVDEETLFNGIEKALMEDENIHFVSTGGAIEGHVEIIFEKFCDRIDKSSVKDRFHLLGWIPHHELFDAMLLSDVAVNCDRWSLEGELGCRNRLFGWLWAGLRVVTTVTSDPTRDLIDQNFAHAFREGNADELANLLVKQAQRGRADGAELEVIHQKLLQKWSPSVFFKSFSKWVKEPQIAPDRVHGEVENPLHELQKKFLEASDNQSELRGMRDLATQISDHLLGSRAIKLYGKAHPETLKLIEELKKLASK